MLLSWLTGSSKDPSPRGAADKPAVRTSAQWCEYFRANAASLLEIPWELGPRITPVESAAIIGSLRVWQLGESSDGAHLRRIARQYAEEIGDSDFVEMMERFIAEEQRHGATLGRYLDACGVPRAQASLGDACFRFCRHCLANMEIFTIPVVMAETHALVFYSAIRQASACPVLQAICGQLLRDEIPHIRMQCERLAILQRDRPTWLRALTMLLQRVFFTGVTLAIWAGHRRALRAGGYGFGRFGRTAWSKMGNAWKAMNPEGYQWECAEQVTGTPEPARS
jgi:hypothetical protein